MKRGWKYGLYGILAVLLLAVAVPLGYALALYLRADYRMPQAKVDLEDYPMAVSGDSLRTIGEDYLVRHPLGLWEARISGAPLERGAKLGKMTGALLRGQESAFVDQIRELVPSGRYLSFLHKLVTVFNWNMAEHVPEEYREEIYGISLSCSHDFDMFGTPYERQMGYHAAHDIGHALQGYMLVGCSSFAVWGAQSADSSLLMARNFDFYVGDAFARNKLVLFTDPGEGYRFASVTWPGMIGVVSGMNEKGLAVTINAAQGKIPTASATPISILVRMILQYADDIDSALALAREHKTFVSEAILVASAKDGCAAVIEKSPSRTALYRSGTPAVLCTNHFQGEAFAQDPYNVENLSRSDSPYRLERLEELVSRAAPVDRSEALGILRNRRGVHDADIGYANQKSINPCIAHHGVIFSPQERKMWVSASPWQMGEFICYQLDSIFSLPFKGVSLSLSREDMAADTVFLAQEYPQVLQYRRMAAQIRESISRGRPLPDGFIGTFLSLNPHYYGAWDLAGDWLLQAGREKEAVEHWRTALEKEVATVNEMEEIQKKIKKHD